MADRKQIILDPSFRKIEHIFAPEDLARLHAVADIVWAKDEPMPEAELDAVREDVSAIITGSWRHGDVSRFPKLEAAMEVSGGPPNPKSLDYDYCFANGVRVLSCAPAFGPAVAELALALALASTRHGVDCHVEFAAGREGFLHDGGAPGSVLFAKPVGFVGFGGLARNLKPLLAPFRCPISVYDPWLPEAYLRGQGVTPVGLDALMAESKVIFVLAIPTPENRGMIDRAALELIASDATFVLISRSHVVDFDSLTEFLYEGRFRAAVDVFPEEPPRPDHPIRNAPNVILSAHRAGSISDALRNIGRITADDVEALAAGLPPMHMQVVRAETIGHMG